MSDLLRSFVRALANVFHPRMLWLTLMPFAAATIVWGALLWFFWQTLTGAANSWLNGWALTSTMYRMFDAVGFSPLHAVIARFLIVIVTIPLIVVTVLLLIATLSMPGVIALLTRKPRGHYASLEERRGGSWYGSLGYSVTTTIVCLMLLVVTLPLWLIPPFFALIPPPLWGWLTYRVMVYTTRSPCTLAPRSVSESRWSLLAIGIISGLLSSVPTML